MYMYNADKNYGIDLQQSGMAVILLSIPANKQKLHLPICNLHLLLDSGRAGAGWAGAG